MKYFHVKYNIGGRGDLLIGARGVDADAALEQAQKQLRKSFRVFTIVSVQQVAG